MKPFGPGFFLMRSVKILVKFLCLLQMHSDCLFLLDLVLVVCVFLGICPYHLSSFGQIVVHSIPLRSCFNFYKISNGALSFIPDFTDKQQF